MIVVQRAIDPVLGEYEVSDVEGAGRLLGYLVDKAMQDGMMKLRFTLDLAQKRCSMHFFGPDVWPPDWPPDGPRRWWEMHSPGFRDYRFILQSIVSQMVFDSDGPTVGHIPAMKNARPLDIKVKMESLCEIILDWSEGMCRRGWAE